MKRITFQLHCLTVVGIFIVGCDAKKTTVTKSPEEPAAKEPSKPSISSPPVVLEAKPGPPGPPTINTFANWAQFLSACTARSDEVSALEHLSTFYEAPKGSSTHRTIMTAPEGMFAKRNDDGSMTCPLGTLFTFVVSVEQPPPSQPLSMAVRAQVVMSGKRVTLLKDAENHWYASWDSQNIIPLLTKTDGLVPPDSPDKGKVFAQQWRLATFLSFMHGLLKPSFTSELSTALCEYLSELPIPESKELLLKMPDNLAATIAAAKDAAIAQWPKTVEIMNKAAAPPRSTEDKTPAASTTDTFPPKR